MKIPVQRLRLVLFLMFLIAGLFAFDFALAQTEKAEIEREAGKLFSEARRLLQEGKIIPAVEDLQRAHVLERSNQEYTLALAEGLIAQGKDDEGAVLLTTVLQNDSNDGQANLLRARLALKTKQFPEAQAYFHRAIYGEWPKDALSRRVQVRLELVKALTAEGKTSDLLPELLPLETDASRDSAVLQQVANYYLIAGSPNRAEATLQQLIRSDPGNAALYQSLGSAELASGDFRAAQKAFLTAFKLKPDDGRIRQDMELSSALFALDPTPRKLRSAEKDQRSNRILQLAAEEAQACLAQTRIRQEERNRIEDQLAQTRQPELGSTNEESEQRLAEAEALWRVQRSACGPGGGLKWNELELLMRKLAQ